MSVVVVTGGTGAIGYAIAKEYAATDDVIITYNSREDDALRISSELHCKAVQADVSDRKSVDRAAAEILREYGHVDVLVNNAGISQIKLFTDTTCDDWQRMIGINLTGCFNMTQAVASSMISRKSGAIVNISSVWGVHGASCEVAYSASKAGVIGFTKALAKELGASGITVNCIAPGVIDSPMNSAHLSQEDLAELCEQTPLMRLGRAEEVAKAVRALVENRFITGQVLGVDGGFY
ncbi:MAG: 3-oxoacyl-ACP reductase FabG [Oscillospiraceae bacterium]|nr:3-oxoacyl-ACP reductase FabG [Oscillospiraceae bacterium]